MTIERADGGDREGLRARKRRETLLRVAENGLRLFVDNGFDETTLESIAAASGISARTLFYYFRTKEEILQYWQGDGFFEALRPVLVDESSRKPPLPAVRDALLDLVARFETDRSIVIDRLMRSTPALRARKQAVFIEMEATVDDVLVKQYRHIDRRTLGAVAMMSIGTLRLAMEAWREDRAARPLAAYVSEGFHLLEKARDS